LARVSRSAFVAGSGALAASLYGSPARAAYGDTPIAGSVTIGIVGPFTGDMSSAGAQLDLGVRAAVDDANQLHGTLDKLFNVRNFDDQNLLATGLQAAEFACDDQTVVCVIGHLSGRITDACLQTRCRCSCRPRPTIRSPRTATATSCACRRKTRPKAG
jgi:ABC-type branched-subunit amino acid transport system substrate-binding protein